MSTTTFARADALTQQLWGKKLAVEALKATPIAPLIGTDSNSVIHLRTELEKGVGDKITVGLRTQLTGKGVSSSSILEGNEEALSTYADSFVVDEIAHAVRVRNPSKSVDAKRVAFNMRSEAKDGLKDWYAKRMSQWFFNHVCGYTPANTEAATTGLLYTGHNAVVAPASGYQLWTEAATTADQDLDSTGDTFTLTILDYAKEKAQTADYPIRPIMVDGEEMYVAYLHPYQVTDLRTVSAAAGSWFDIQKAAITGGKTTKNPIFTGALGVYNGIVLRSSYDVTSGVNSSTGAAITTVKRAVLLGAQAAMMAMPEGSSDSFDWVEETFDYDRELGVAVKALGGLKKSIFNSKDFGCIVMSSYAAAHS
jgi:N4-gp56 family major capsid protein